MPWAEHPQSALQAFIKATELYITKRLVRATSVLPVSASNATTMDCSKADVFTYTVTEATTIAAINPAPGQVIRLLVQAAAGAIVVTFGAGFATTGTLTTAADATKDYVVTFVSDGTTVFEASRTAALTTV